MSLLFMDGFDAYATAQIVDKWTNSNQLSGSNVTIASPGRFGSGNRLDQTPTVAGNLVGINKSLIQGPQTSLVNGFAWKYGGAAFASPGTCIWALFDSTGAILASIFVNAAGGLEYHVGLSATPLVSSNPGIVNVQAWGHVGLDVVLSSSAAGSVLLYFNGNQIASISSVVTAANANGCSMLGPSLYTTDTHTNPATQSYDDIYMFNKSGGVHTTFVGDCECLSQVPNGAGHVTDFTPVGSSPNWACVNEIPPDSDTTYVEDSTVGDKDAYTNTNLTNVSTVVAVQLCAFARKDSSPARSLALGWSNGTTDVLDAGHFLNTSYTYELSPLDQNPVSAAPWTVSDINTEQVVIQVAS